MATHFQEPAHTEEDHKGVQGTQETAPKEKQSLGSKIKNILHIGGDRKVADEHQATFGGAETTGHTTTTSNKDTTNYDNTTADNDGVTSSSEHVNATRERGETATQSHMEVGQQPQTEAEWDAAQRKLEEARRQALIIEEASREAYEKSIIAAEAQRKTDTARREQLEVQERLAALELDAKRAEFQRYSEQYESQRAALAHLSRDVDASRANAAELKDSVNQHGRALEQEVNETKLHTNRLAQIEAELARLRAAAQEAEARHQESLVQLDSLRQHYSASEAEVVRLEREQGLIASELKRLQDLQSSNAKRLKTTKHDFDNVASELTALETAAKKRAKDVEARAREVAELEAAQMEVQHNLGLHRQAVGEMSQQTQAAMQQAEALIADANRKEEALRVTQAGIADNERRLAAQQQALQQAEQQRGQLEEHANRVASNVTSAEQHSQRTIEEFDSAKDRVLNAEGYKGQLWQEAKEHGERADYMAQEHFNTTQQTLLNTPAGTPAAPMAGAAATGATSNTGTDASVAPALGSNVAAANPQDRQLHDQAAHEAAATAAAHVPQ
jgi:hypothetical protein